MPEPSVFPKEEPTHSVTDVSSDTTCKQADRSQGSWIASSSSASCNQNVCGSKRKGDEGLSAVEEDASLWKRRCTLNGLMHFPLTQASMPYVNDSSEDDESPESA